MDAAAKKMTTARAHFSGSPTFGSNQGSTGHQMGGVEEGFKVGIIEGDEKEARE